MKGIAFSHKGKVVQAIIEDGLVTIYTIDYVKGAPYRVSICRDKIWKGLRWYFRTYEHLF